MSYDQQLDSAFRTTIFKTGITLDYAAIAHPGAWQQRSGLPATGGSVSAYGDFSTSLSQATGAHQIGDHNLRDGEVLINYDAMLTAVTAIRNASPTGGIPPRQDIAGQWLQLYGVHKVDGATGWICLDNAGNPYDKAVPIVQYGPGGGPTFVRLAWPTGNPPAGNCLVPQGG